MTYYSFKIVIEKETEDAGYPHQKTNETSQFLC